MKRINQKTFIILILILCAVGMFLRWRGIWYVAVDYELCFEPWYMQLKEAGSLKALADWKEDYNIFYATILYFLTLTPIEPIIGIKMVPILFDYLEAFLMMKIAMTAGKEEGRRHLYGLIAFALVMCNPLSIIDSAYLAQSDGIWSCLALFGFWYIYQEKPVKGMWMLGFALSMKLQAVFIMPIILILYFYRKKFSILHLLWIPVAIQALCIPALIGGGSFDIAYRAFFNWVGEYPYMYYYYPNIWTYFQEAPYYVFGKVAIVLAFTALLMFAVLFVQSARKHSLQDCLEYVAWTTMTCAMLLPCMHERYNFTAEIVLPICAIFNRRLRLPALALILIAMQCYGQSYLGWNRISPYALAAGNLLLYFYLTWKCFYGLYDGYRAGKEAEVC